MISLKTKNLANHTISKVLVSDGVPISDLAGVNFATLVGPSAPELQK